MSYKVYIPHGSTFYANWVGPIVDTLSKADLVLFTGGTDICSSLYNEKPNPNNDTPDKIRDALEVQVFLEAYHRKLPLLGICRGAQFLCVKAGGKLVQHQTNNGSHDMIPVFNDTALAPIEVTSSHHQAQYPWKIKDFKLLGYTYGVCKYHHDGEGKEIVSTPTANLPEVEDCYYPAINALAIQSHPEWMYPPKNQHQISTIGYYKNLLKMFMENKL